jgi:hypothetical protein
MTPKEKANQLYDDAYSRWCNELSHDKNILIAKSISTYVCDKLLEIFEGLHKPESCAFDAIGDRKYTFDSEYEGRMTGYDMVDYFQQVKEEIEKL